MSSFHTSTPSLLTTADTDIMIQLNTLKEEQRNYEADERYLEAQMCIRKISELKQKLNNDKVSELKMKQSEETYIIESNYQAELTSFNDHWDSVIKNFLEKCGEQDTKLMQKHREIIQKEREKLEGSISKTYKPSVQLLNMIKCKEKAARTQKYLDAYSLLKSIEEMKQYENSRYLEQRQSKIDQQLETLELKLRKEAENLQKRQKSSLDELNKQKSVELSVVVKKYENVRRELENVQNIETNKKKGRHTTAAGRYDGNSTFRIQARSTSSSNAQRSQSISPSKRVIL